MTTSNHCASFSAVVGIAPKYLDIDSTYRNRELYPHPTDFIVTGGLQQVLDDPIVDGLPVHYYQGTQYEVLDVPVVGGTAAVPQLSPTLSNRDGYYVGGMITNQRTQTASIIISYDGDTHLVQTIGSMDFQVGDKCNITDPSTARIVSVFYPDKLPTSTQYVGMYLVDRTISESRVIVDYNPITQLIQLDKPFGSKWAKTDYYEITTTLSYLYQSENKSALIIGNTIHVNPNSINFNPVGKYVRVISTGINYNKFSLILNYDKLTGVMTVDSKGGWIDETDATVEILDITRGNSVNLSITPSCRLDKGTYEVQLVSLTLPNAPILGSSSLYLASFPYIYVEFGNAHASSQSQIISNNPHSTKSLFKIPVYDLPSTNISTFIRLSSNMRHIIYFNPNEDIRVRIYLPFGKLVTYQADAFSPYAPNELFQVSMTVSLVRVKQ